MLCPRCKKEVKIDSNEKFVYCKKCQVMVANPDYKNEDVKIKYTKDDKKNYIPELVIDDENQINEKEVNKMSEKEEKIGKRDKRIENANGVIKYIREELECDDIECSKVLSRAISIVRKK